MSEAKFTKGDWVVLPIENDKEYIRIRGSRLGGKYKIANVIDLKDHHNGSEWCKRDRAESMANAQLIKAAPKMYKFLDDLVNGGLDESHNNELIKLLAEARGEQ